MSTFWYLQASSKDVIFGRKNYKGQQDGYKTCSVIHMLMNRRMLHVISKIIAYYVCS